MTPSDNVPQATVVAGLVLLSADAERLLDLYDECERQRAHRLTGEAWEARTLVRAEILRRMEKQP